MTKRVAALDYCTCRNGSNPISRHATGLPIIPPVTKTLHYVPPNDAIGTLARVMTYIVFAVMGITVILALAAGMASPGHTNTGKRQTVTCCFPRCSLVRTC